MKEKVKNRLIIVGVITLWCLIFFAVGTIYGMDRVCRANDGILTSFDTCILDKCIEDMHVCREGNDFYFVERQINLSLDPRR